MRKRTFGRRRAQGVEPAAGGRRPEKGKGKKCKGAKGMGQMISDSRCPISDLKKGKGMEH
jgi:hypothetical protein